MDGNTQLAKLVGKILICQMCRNRSLDEAIREEISENVVADIHCLVSFEMQNEFEQNMTKSLLTKTIFNS